MKVLFANLPWEEDNEFYGLRAGSRWPHLRLKKESLPYYPFPFFMAYAAATVEKDHDIMFKDCITEGITENQFLDKIEEFSPEAAIFETATPTVDKDMTVIRKIKERLPQIKIALAGQHASAYPDKMLSSNDIDYVMMGEYDYTAKDIINSLDTGSDINNISGLAYKENGKSIVKGYSKLIPNLDDLPYPARHHLPMGKYTEPFCKHTPNVQMISSRGCPYSCTFCLEPSVFYGRSNYRMRSPESVVNEMEQVKKTFKAKEIYFDDSSFSVNQARVKAICHEIKERRLDIAWSCMADAKMELDTLKEMRSAGCVAFKFGVESSDSQILKNINKPVNLELIRRVVKYCRQAGIESHATFIFGLPGETRETIKNTINFAFKELKTDTAQFSVAIPYPGTPFYNEAVKNNWIKTSDYSQFNGGLAPVVEYPGLPGSDIMNAARYCRRKQIIKVITTPRQAMQYARSVYNYSGFKGLVSTAFEKMGYLLTGSSL